MLSFLPNLISISRVILIVPYIYLFYGDGKQSTLFALAVIIIVTDLLDGALARKFHVESKLGSILDSIADAFFVVSSWLLFYFKDYYSFNFLLVLLIPRVAMGLLFLFHRYKKIRWNNSHLLGDKLIGMTSFIIIAYLLSGLIHQDYVLVGLVAVMYLGLLLTLRQRSKAL